ncbi:GntR family transcriptional regulator [Streptomyces sp. NPDC015171]
MESAQNGRAPGVEAQVRALLEEGLRSGRLAPGDRLPTERALVE